MNLSSDGWLRQWAAIGTHSASPVNCVTRSWQTWDSSATLAELCAMSAMLVSRQNPRGNTCVISASEYLIIHQMSNVNEAYEWCWFLCHSGFLNMNRKSPTASMERKRERDWLWMSKSTCSSYSSVQQFHNWWTASEMERWHLPPLPLQLCFLWSRIDCWCQRSQKPSRIYCQWDGERCGQAWWG